MRRIALVLLAAVGLASAVVITDYPEMVLDSAWLTTYGGRSRTNPNTAGDSWVLVPKWALDSMIAAGAGGTTDSFKLYYGLLSTASDSWLRPDSAVWLDTTTLDSRYSVADKFTHNDPADSSETLYAKSAVIDTTAPRAGYALTVAQSAWVRDTLDVGDATAAMGAAALRVNGAICAGDGAVNSVTGVLAAVIGGGSLGLGGDGNDASGKGSIVAGGYDNQSSDSFAAVVGGQLNTASMVYAVVAGGSGNTASGANSAVLGGEINTASGTGAVVAGGSGNTASGSHSAIWNGGGCVASDSGSMIIGFKNGCLNSGKYSLVVTFGDNDTNLVAHRFRVAGGHAVIDDSVRSPQFEATDAGFIGPGAVVPGTVIDWYGDSSAFPTGYVLCDGTRKFKTAAGDSLVTPDLRNFFTIGASIDTGNGIPMSSIEDTTGAVAKATGGSVKYTPAGTNSGTTIDDHTKTTDGDIPGGGAITYLTDPTTHSVTVEPTFTGTRAVLVQPYVACWKLVKSRTW